MRAVGHELALHSEVFVVSARYAVVTSVVGTPSPACAEVAGSPIPAPFWGTAIRLPDVVGITDCPGDGREHDGVGAAPS